MKLLKYILLVFVISSGLRCKKKTTIDVQVFNYALNEAVPNAKVVLVERKTPGLLSSNYSCEEIANAITDGKGNCYFEKERLRKNSRYQYYLAVSEIYGKMQSYPCGGKTSGFLKIGGSQQNILQAGSTPAYFKIRYNNFLSPAQSGDSIIINIRNPEYSTPGSDYTTGGGGVYIDFLCYQCNGYPFPSVVTISELRSTDAGKNTIHVRKRKLGVVTTTVDTIKIYPYETKTIEINW